VYGWELRPGCFVVGFLGFHVSIGPTREVREVLVVESGYKGSSFWGLVAGLLGVHVHCGG
jgi:hypothetical protein